MGKLLRAELYQLVRKKGFYLCILGVGVISFYFYFEMRNVKSQFEKLTMRCMYQAE